MLMPTEYSSFVDGLSCLLRSHCLLSHFQYVRSEFILKTNQRRRNSRQTTEQGIKAIVRTFPSGHFKTKSSNKFQIISMAYDRSHD